LLTFVRRSRSVRVLGAGLAVLAVLAAAARLLIQDWQVWFWAVTVIASAELLFTAGWDLAAEFNRKLRRLVTDQDDRWPPWAHAVLVPLFLVLGLLADHLWVH
jgi:hypothetical protein